MDFIPVRALIASVLTQVEGASWSLPLLALPSSSRSATKPAIPLSAAQATATSKLRGLPHPCLGVLIIAKHLAYAGREEWNFVQVEEEYLRFARTRLVGSGKVRIEINQRYALKDAAQAHIDLEGRKTTGSTILIP